MGKKADDVPFLLEAWRGLSVQLARRMEVSELLHILKKLQDRNCTRHFRKCCSTATQFIMLIESVGNQDCRNILKAEKASRITSFFGGKIQELRGNPKHKGFISELGFFVHL